MNTRLHQFLAAENLTQAQFAESINVAPAGVSHVLAGRNKPGYDFLYNMMLHYPDLNLEWLLTGRGKMYKTQGAPEPSLFDQENAAEDSLFAPVRRQDSVSATPLSPASTPAAQAAPAQKSLPEAIPTAPQPLQGLRRAAKVIVFYDDGTFQEM